MGQQMGGMPQMGLPMTPRDAFVPSTPGFAGAGGGGAQRFGGLPMTPRDAFVPSTPAFGRGPVPMTPGQFPGSAVGRPAAFTPGGARMPGVPFTPAVGAAPFTPAGAAPFTPGLPGAAPFTPAPNR